MMMKKSIIYQNPFHTLVEKSKNDHLAKAIKSIGPLEIPVCGFKKVHHFLAHSVVGQQLSIAAARTIWNRVDTFSKCYGEDITELEISIHSQEIRACGVSYNKIKALEALATFFQDSNIEKRLTDLDHDQRSKLLTSIWGIGQWTCDMASIFYYSERDIWPLLDAGLKRGLSKIESNNIDFENFADAYRPYRSYLCLYLWHIADNEVF